MKSLSCQFMGPREKYEAHKQSHVSLKQTTEPHGKYWFGRARATFQCADIFELPSWLGGVVKLDVSGSERSCCLLLSRHHQRATENMPIYYYANWVTLERVGWGNASTDSWSMHYSRAMAVFLSPQTIRDISKSQWVYSILSLWHPNKASLAVHDALSPAQ